MPIDVRGVCHFWGGVISVLRKRQHEPKWTDEQQRELTRQLCYWGGKKREFPIIKEYSNSSEAIPRSKSKSRRVLPMYRFSVLRGP